MVIAGECLIRDFIIVTDKLSSDGAPFKPKLSWQEQHAYLVRGGEGIVLNLLLFSQPEQILILIY